MADVRKQLEIKQAAEYNCEELKRKFKDVLEFQRQMKETEKLVKTGSSDSVENKDIKVPVRSQLRVMPTEDDDAKDPHTLANGMKEKGNKCVKLEQYEEALSHYTAAIETFPDDPIYYTNRALCNLKLDRQNRAIEDCNIAISLDRKYVKAFYRRMQANESLGNWEAAVRDCETVMRLDPSIHSLSRQLSDFKKRLMKERNHTSRDEINNNRKREESWKGVPGKPWSRLDREAKEVDFVEKKPHLRSKKPLKRIEIVENHTQPEPIPDHIVDKLFNNFTGEYSASSSSSPPSAFDYGLPVMALPFAPRPSTSQEVEDDVFDHLAKYNEQKKAKESPPPRQEIAPELPPKTKKVELPAQEDSAEAELEQAVPEVPATNIQFCSTWKDLTEKTRCGYLEAIVGANSGVIKALGPLLDSVLLSQLLATMQRHFVQKELPVHSILDALATNSEINILSMFMSTSDRKAMEELVGYMGRTEVDKNIIVSIQKAFNIAQ